VVNQIRSATLKKRCPPSYGGETSLVKRRGARQKKQCLLGVKGGGGEVEMSNGPSKNTRRNEKLQSTRKRGKGKSKNKLSRKEEREEKLGRICESLKKIHPARKTALGEMGGRRMKPPRKGEDGTKNVAIRFSKEKLKEQLSAGEGIIKEYAQEKEDTVKPVIFGLRGRGKRLTPRNRIKSLEKKKQRKGLKGKVRDQRKGTNG